MSGLVADNGVIYHRGVDDTDGAADAEDFGAEEIV